MQKQYKLKELKDKLQIAIIDERYEDAAKIRDEIKEIEGEE
jgi:protein-arginine kinase activator protein McsA